MLDNIEYLAQNYLKPEDSYHAGLIGIDNPLSMDYIEGLYNGKHFHRLIYVMKNNYFGVSNPYAFMLHNRDEEFEKFKIYSTKYMNEYICYDYLRYSDINRYFKIAILKRMTKLVELD